MKVNSAHRFRQANIFFIATALILIAASAIADDSPAINVIGQGNASCGDWAESRKNNTDDSWFMMQWFLGYEIGAADRHNAFVSIEALKVDNVKTINPLGGIDYNSVALWLDKYCRDNPLNRIHSAAAAFSFEHPQFSK